MHIAIHYIAKYKYTQIILNLIFAILTSTEKSNFKKDLQVPIYICMLMIFIIHKNNLHIYNNYVAKVVFCGGVVM